MPTDHSRVRGALIRLLMFLIPDAGHMRTFAVNSLIASVGFGLYTSGSAVYFVRAVGLTPSQVGLGLSLSALTGFAVSLPVGKLADRFGPRGVTMWLTTGQAVVLVALSQIESFVPYLVLIGLLGGMVGGSNVARNALVAGVLPKGDRVRTSSFVRSTFNLGFSLGTLFAGLAIASDTTVGYQALIFGNAGCALGVAAMLLKLPRVPGHPVKGADKRARATRDVPYISVAVACGMTRLGSTILTVALPVWLVTSTSAPKPFAAWLIGINTIMIIVLQVRVASKADEPAQARRFQRLAFLGLAGACLTMILTTQTPVWVAVPVLVAATVLLTFAELWGESARWSLRYSLAPEHAHGAYGGIFNMGSTIPALVGPAIITFTVFDLGRYGWSVLATAFLALIVPATVAIKWAERTRPPEPPDDEQAVGEGEAPVSAVKDSS